MSRPEPIADLEEALALLAQAPSGGVGPDGATIAEIATLNENGQVLEDDSMVDLCQHVYRLVQGALVVLGDAP